MKQVINQSVCPILGIRVYTPLVNELGVAMLCMRLNTLSARRYFKTLKN
jgi:hypothetical protein